MNFKILTILILLLPTVILSQTSFDFGILAGANSSYLGGDDFSKNRELRIGFLVGISSNLNFTDSLSLEIEINYSSKGQINDPYAGVQIAYYGPYAIERNYYYLSLPLILNYKFYKTNQISTVLEVGSEFSFLLESKWEYDIPNSFTSRNVDDITESFDVGLVIGLKVFIPIFSQKTFVGIRYVHGLMEVLPKSEIFDSVKHRTFSLITGFYF